MEKLGIFINNETYSLKTISIRNKHIIKFSTQFSTAPNTFTFHTDFIPDASQKRQNADFFPDTTPVFFS